MTGVAADTTVLKALRKVRQPQPQRNRELLLLLFAIALSLGATALSQLGELGRIDSGVLIAEGVLAALVLALHVVLRLRAPQADPFVVPIATLLTGLGIAMIYRLGISGSELVDPNAANKQLIYAGVSILAAGALVWALGNYRILFRYTYVFGFTGIVLLILPFVPFINGGGNATVWIEIGGVNFQPGEIAKICLAIFFAGYLVRTRESLTSTGRRILGFTFPRAREFGPLLVIWLVSMVIIVAQRDLGTGLLIFGMFVATLYVATGKTGWVLIGVLLAVGGAVAASYVLPYVRGRFDAWLGAFDPALYEAEGGSYQLVNGIFGLAHGGLLGTGLGLGRPYLTPVSQSDYIIPSLGEELGLTGLFAILCLYLVFVARGLRIGVAGQDDFGKLLAVALSFTLALQVFIMVGGVTRLVPLTGLTTPFLAAGGSSLLANWLIVAVILRISDAVRQQPRAVIG
ncbi:FtsW/RodA/SpoVE family cell cycle protein [Microbacterium paludicola]|uniref:FtsW/RodA/SpoVE family cell cycle protein n=1 Tax=Microbacterium paludicola TaxID=300019 RepID=A0A4Y9FT08_9MICO|nr:FtsW/RodA/SpoVE family cell cycle protein [Microbacterium paludicola]MBF0816919.1 FtsW/RodA/SpoVE family cell cycle protein [Microbacterium paludicola]TFU32364.1 FtsW/RodA/SpoVE family cell cycle protein [Microbacterium paludicola]